MNQGGRKPGGAVSHWPPHREHLLAETGCANVALVLDLAVPEAALLRSDSTYSFTQKSSVP